MADSRIDGFTLIELMVTVAVLAVILVIAVPSFRDFATNNRLTNHTNRLVSDLNLARSESLKRRQEVFLCRSADPTIGSPTCGGTANTWTTGWLVFIDGNGNNTFESASDELLRVGEPAASGISIRADGTADASGRISYRGDGRLNIAVGTTATFAICADRDGDGDLDESHGRQISATAIGQITTSGGRGTTAISTCTPS